jgi:hypothetical protein
MYLDIVFLIYLLNTKALNRNRLSS